MKWTRVLLALVFSTGDTARIKQTKSNDAVIQQAEDHNKTPAYKIPKDDDGTPVGIKCNDEALAQIKEWMDAGIASFDADKEMVMRCSCQNYVFTAQQAGSLIGMMTWSDNQADAVEMFRDRLTNPNEGTDILNKINGEEDKSKVTAMLKEFKAAKPVDTLAYPFGNHGTRADEDVNEFANKLNKQSCMEDCKEQAAKDEMKERPSPPFSAAQLETVLEKFTWGSQVSGLLETLAGPLAIYPLTCEEIDKLVNRPPKVGNAGFLYMADDRLEMLRALKPFIKDAQNKPLLVSKFEFPDDKKTAEEILRDVTVKFKLVPPKPTGAGCASGLTRLELCCAYAVYGGWRCDAGYHFISDEAANQQLAKMSS